jgi:hypothetical protein
MEAISIRIIQIGLHMLFPSIVLKARPSTGTQHKSLGWLGIGPGPKSVDATWPVRLRSRGIGERSRTGRVFIASFAERV